MTKYIFLFREFLMQRSIPQFCKLKSIFCNMKSRNRRRNVATPTHSRAGCIDPIRDS